MPGSITELNPRICTHPISTCKALMLYILKQYTYYFKMIFFYANFTVLRLRLQFYPERKVIFRNECFYLESVQRIWQVATLEKH